MRRFYIEDLSEDASNVFVTGEEFVHISKVLRLRQGTAVVLFNGEGLELTGRLEAVFKDYAVVAVDSATRLVGESRLKTALIVGLVKADKPELIIQKSTELGVTELVFYPADRSVPVADADRAGQRLIRWRRVAIEAAKQCGRSTLPRLSLAPDMSVALNGLDGMLKLQLWESEKDRGLNDVLKEPLSENGVAFLVGPEGGFAEEEVEAARLAGFITVSLGPRILRAETAAIVMLAIIQHRYGDMR
ncbi:MAG: hypothetical protein A3J24_00375 [Deltaproteobacteria bacterium RIFCSPLOWO2_02_FULL_53_8]|nr:MAG: hypothetical protein A3J24_00375 [Deltaproteobacteria bacterium RIFCSPLOWO2_02_FULL_53_8]